MLCIAKKYLVTIILELKLSGGWSTGTVDWSSASERGQYLDGCPAMNTKCLTVYDSITIRTQV